MQFILTFFSPQHHFYLHYFHYFHFFFIPTIQSLSSSDDPRMLCLPDDHLHCFCSFNDRPKKHCWNWKVKFKISFSLQRRKSNGVEFVSKWGISLQFTWNTGLNNISMSFLKIQSTNFSNNSQFVFVWHHFLETLKL